MLRTAFAAALVLVACPAMACSVSDFAVEGFKVGAKNDCELTPCPVLKITGFLKNSCAQPAGAQIKLTALDKAGNVLGTSESWPASTKNIGPGKKWAFDLGWSLDYDATIKRIDWEIIDARTW